MNKHQPTSPFPLRTYLVAASAAGFIALSNYLLGVWFTAHGIHGEATIVDEILLAIFTAALVFVLDSSYQHDRKRADEIDATNAVLMKQSEAVHRLSAQLMTLQDEERRRIARNLHDSVGQLVVAAMLQVSTIQEEENRLTQVAATSVEETATLLRQISQEIRTISHLLHPPLLDEVGLEAALHCYVDGFAKRSKVAVQLNIPPGTESPLSGSRDLDLSDRPGIPNEHSPTFPQSDRRGAY